VNSKSGIRLNKFISDSGHCSRREADKLIENNRVKVNGAFPQLGTRVEPGDEVCVDGMTIQASASNKSDRVYLVYNKPVGITCTTERSVRGNIIDAIDHDQRIFPIGRLDKPSEGLILLTSDGDIVNKILRAENAHDKEYLVTVDKPLNDSFAAKMSKGIPILDTVTKPCKVNIQSRFAFTIILTQGLNRQIRRMCDYLGYEVKLLKRQRIMSIQLGRLKPGQWRNLSREEVAEINAAVSNSSSETTKKRKQPPSRPGHVKNRPPAKSDSSRSHKSDSKKSRHAKPKSSSRAKTNKPKAKQPGRRRK
jgi:pseudouridine synthase